MDAKASKAYSPDYQVEMIQVELVEAIEERDRLLRRIAGLVEAGNIKRIDPEDLERAARLARTVRLLAAIVGPDVIV